MSNLIWSSLARATLQGSFALLAVYLICRVSHRLPAWGKCWLWRIAWLRLFLAFASTAAFEFHFISPDSFPAAAAVAAPPSATISVPLSIPAVSSIPQNPTSTSRAFDGRMALAVIWILGGTALLLRLLFQYRAVRRLKNSAIPNSAPELDAPLAVVAHELGARSPALLISDAIAIPLLAGIFRPMIFLPKSLVNLDPDKLELIFKHEVAHLKRGDLLWNWLPALAQILFWFNPLVWFSSRESALAQEMAADEVALCNDQLKSAPLAQLLLDLVAAPRSTLPPQIFTASVAHPKSNLERRVRALRFIRSPGKRGAALVCSSLLLAAPVLLPWRIVAEKIEPPQTEKTPAAEKTERQQLTASDLALEEVLSAELAIAEKQLEALTAQVKNGVSSNEELIAQKRDVLQLKRRLAATHGDYKAVRENLESEIALVSELQLATANRVKAGVASTDEQRKIDRELLRLKADALMFEKSNDTFRSNQRNSITPPSLAGPVMDLAKTKPDPARNVRNVVTTRSGRIANVGVKVGERVKQGQVLAFYDVRADEIKLRTAEAEFKIAQADFGLKKLDAKKSVEEATGKVPPSEIEYLKEKTSLDLQRAEAQLEIARVKVDQARQEARHDDTDDYVRSPVIGTVQIVNAVNGMGVKENETIFVILKD